MCQALWWALEVLEVSKIYLPVLTVSLRDTCITANHSTNCGCINRGMCRVLEEKKRMKIVTDNDRQVERWMDIDGMDG